MFLSLNFTFCICSIHCYILKQVERTSKQVSYLPMGISLMHNGRKLTGDWLQQYMALIFLQNGLLQIADHFWLVPPQCSLTHQPQFLAQKIPRFLSAIHLYKYSTFFLIFPSCTYNLLNSFIFARTPQLWLYNCVLCPRFFLFYSLFTATAVLLGITNKIANQWCYLICSIRQS